MSAAMAVATAVTFAWVGIVVGISFVEAPVKFRAPGVTLQIGLGIGRLVFRVINAIEVLLAIAIVIALISGAPEPASWVLLGIAVVALAAQLIFVRPRLARRADAVLAGGEAPRSHAHHAYIAFEIVKLLALLAGGTSTLATG